MGEFHHRSTLKQTNKSFKSVFASKRTQKDKAKGKVERESVKVGLPARKVQHKVDRRNSAKVAQRKKRDDLLSITRLFQGRRGASKIVAIVPLCPDISASATVAAYYSALEQDFVTTDNGVYTVNVEQFKQHVQFIVIARNMLDVLDAAKVADVIVFVVSSKIEVDSFGELLLSSVMAQGVPLTVTVVQHLEQVNGDKQKHEIRKALLSYMKDWLPDSEKVYAQSEPSECITSLRVITQSTPKHIAWRDRHAYMVVDECASVPANSGDESMVDLHLSGFVRGSMLSANRLMYIPGFGDYQVKHITSAIPEHARTLSTDGGTNTYDAMDSSDIIDSAVPEQADDLVAMNEMDPMAGEQTWPTEHELAEGDAQARKMTSTNQHRRTKRVPVGTSSYQAAWIVDSDNEDSADDQELSDEDATIDIDGDDNWVDANGGSSGNFSEVANGVVDKEEEEEYENVDVDDRASTWEHQLDENEEKKQLDEYLERKKEEGDDLEFPDEMDTPTHIPARIRFQRYRGLKSFHKSPWDPYENLPVDYVRLFQFEDFRRTKGRVIRESKRQGVAVGTYVTVTVLNVPLEVQNVFKSRLFWVASLLQYERKMSTVSFSVTRREVYKDPIKSKDPVVVQVGFRRFVANPIYSRHSKCGPGANNVHKFERYLQFGRLSIATIYGPVTFGPSPVLMLRPGDQAPQLIAVGTVLDCDPTRIIAKRIILTGHPFKINKRSAVIRYMFFNPTDIDWFKPVELVTKHGRRGHIRESLGTHGYMKCILDGPIQQMDTVCMYLYKRCFPKQFATVMSNIEASEKDRWSAQDNNEDKLLQNEVNNNDVEMV